MSKVDTERITFSLMELDALNSVVMSTPPSFLNDCQKAAYRRAYQKLRDAEGALATREYFRKEGL